MPRQIHLKLPDQLHRALRILAAASDTTVQDYVVGAIRKQISEDGQKLEVARKSVAQIADEAGSYESNRD